MLPCLSAPTRCNLIVTASQWLAPLPDHSTEHQGHQGAGGRHSRSLCLIHGPRDTAKERSSPSSWPAHLLPLATQGWGSARRDQFSGGQKKIPPEVWVLDANPAAETQTQERSRMPPWTQRLLEKRQLSWRKPSGSSFVMLFSCGGLDGVRASPLPSPCRSRGERAPGRVSVQAAVCPSLCMSV